MEKKPPANELKADNSSGSELKFSDDLLNKLAGNRLKEIPGSNEEKEEKKHEKNKRSKEKRPFRRFAEKFGRIFAGLVSFGGEKAGVKNQAELVGAEAPFGQESDVGQKPSKEPSEAEKQLESTEEGGAAAPYNAPEHIGQIVRRVEKNNTGTLAAAERLNKRREQKARHRIRKLKKEAKTARREREEITKQQKEFERKLDENIKETKRLANAKTSPESVAILEPKLAQAHGLKTPEAELQQVQEPEITREQIENLVHPERIAQPEAVLEKVAEAAEQNIPLESLYERRHEAKDENASQARITSLSAQLKRGQKGPASAGFSTSSPDFSLKLDKLQREEQKHSAQANEPAMYKQAVVSGFITAVVLLAVLTVLILLA